MKDNQWKLAVFSVVTMLLIAATMMPFSWTLGTSDGSNPTEYAQEPLLNGMSPDHTAVDVLNRSLGVRIQTETAVDSRVTVSEDERPFVQTADLRSAARSHAVRIQSPTSINSGTISFQLSSSLSDSTSSSVYWHKVGSSSLVRQATTFDRENNSVIAPITGTGTYIVLSDPIWSERASREPTQRGSTVQFTEFSTDSEIQRAFPLPHLQNRSVEGTAVIRFPSRNSSATISLKTPSNEIIELVTFNRIVPIVNVTREVSFSESIPGSTGGQATVLLTTTNGASITVEELDVVSDSDGDGLTDHAERNGLPTEFGRIYTDPFDSDTDGDGIDDGVEIVPLDSSVNQYNFQLNSDPTHYDSDGDGISDYMEFNTHSEVIRTTNIYGTEEAQFYSRHSGEADFDIYWSNGSDPLEPDTDNDGVDDLIERQVQLDPSDPDTDEDQILDGEELLRDTDPSLYDDEPPEIEVVQKSSRISLDSLAMEHRLVYVVEDPAGVDRSSVRTSEKVYDQEELRGTDSQVVTTTYETWLFTDVDVEVHAVDENGNEVQTVNLVRPAKTESFYEELLEDGAPSVSEIYYNGFIRGVGTFVSEEFWSIINAPGDFVGFLKRLAEDPIAVIGTSVDTLRMLTDRGIIDTLIEGFDANLEEKQKSVNPYEFDSREYGYFEDGYKAGFAIPLLLTLAIPAGQAKNVGRGAKLASTANDVSGAVRALRRAAEVPDRLMSAAKNAGSRHRIWRAQRELSPKTLNEFRGEKESRLSSYLEQGGPDAARALEIQPGIRSVLSTDGVDIDPKTRVDASLSLARAADSGVSKSRIDAVAARIRAQDSDRALLYRMLASDGPDHGAVRFVADSDERELSALMALSRDGGLSESDVARYAREAGPRGGSVPFASLRSNLDTVDRVEHSGDMTIVRGTVSDTSVSMKYPDDGTAYLNSRFDLGDSSFQGRQQRADLAENTIAPQMAGSKDYPVLSRRNKQVTDEGIDMIARSPDGEIVIIEVKSTARGRAIGSSDFRSTRTGPNGETYDQMTDQWIQSSFRDSTPDEIRSYDQVEAAIQSGSYRREAFVVQNSRNGASVRASIGSRVDHVEILKLGDSDRIASIREPQMQMAPQYRTNRQVMNRGVGVV